MIGRFPGVVGGEPLEQLWQSVFRVVEHARGSLVFLVRHPHHRPPRILRC